ncbi:PTS glucose transporter subunit IIA [Amphibacillus sp. MSJ-3]|uniref:PTS sugar transporter subunit IIA n=1 Tax=Amphibacillus sp. MSJ-3 TaxID=2841505 RepID=UPI001C0F0AA5|nr:PTS glucose transporter subunit IIA [Amphibacillus sp. MSJ-3]MBU5595261.1 PTS glucose transporter subunit IIA [Amphibacillus sp. MSJ-3]
MLKNLFKKTTKREIIAPLSGQLVSLDQVPDPVFAEKMMGEGVAIIPTDGRVVAPVNGRIIQIPQSKHAVGIEAEDGTEILIHIGLETVRLKGQGFEELVKVNDQVKVGDPLLTVDLTFIEDQADSTITPVIITNSKSEMTYQFAPYTQVIAGKSPIITIVER